MTRDPGVEVDINPQPGSVSRRKWYLITVRLGPGEEHLHGHGDRLGGIKQPGPFLVSTASRVHSPEKPDLPYFARPIAFRSRIGLASIDPEVHKSGQLNPHSKTDRLLLTTIKSSRGLPVSPLGRIMGKGVPHEWDGPCHVVLPARFPPMPLHVRM